MTQNTITEFFSKEGFDTTFSGDNFTLSHRQDGTKINCNKHYEYDAYSVNYSDHYRKRLSTVLKYVKEEYHLKIRLNEGIRLSESNGENLKIAFELCGIDLSNYDHSTRNNYSGSQRVISSRSALINMNKISDDFQYGDQLHVKVDNSGEINYIISLKNLDLIPVIQKLADEFKENWVSTQL